MALVPQFFVASTKEVAEKSLERGYLKYPGICFITSSNELAWISIDNTIRYVQGNGQITDINYKDDELLFYSGDEVIFAYNVKISPQDVERMIEQITNDLDLNAYAKTKDVVRLLDDKVGDLGDKANVAEYVESLAYDDLNHVPIVNLVGTLTKVIVVSELNEGVYKIKGQYMIGGNHTTIQMSPDDNLFIVTHSEHTATAITHLSGQTIRIYFIENDGTYTLDRYITETWINEKDFISSASVKEYVREIITDTVTQIIDETLDARLDIVLEDKLDNIDSDDILRLF